MEKKVKRDIRANKPMPYSLEAEQSLLGCILIDGSISMEITSEFKTSDFYSNVHRMIYDAMLALVKAAKPIDLVTLSDELDNSGNLAACGGYEYLATVMQSVPGASNYRHYADIVKRNALRRNVISAAGEIAEKAFADEDSTKVLAFAEKSVYDISSEQDTSTLVSLSDSFSDVIVKFNTIQSDKNAFRGLMTGFTDLDKMTNGLQNSDLILIAARPSVGKTSFACNIIEGVSVLGNAVSAVFSLEMGKSQLAQRMICSVANVSMERALKGNLDKHDWEEIWKANELVSRAKIFVDDSALVTPQEMLSKCRRLKSVHGLDLVMIDYIQLMQADRATRDNNRQQEVSEISRNLKLMAKELNVPVIALSQLSREAEKDGGRPQLSHLRESGAIEQDADIVMFIHRPDRLEKNQDKVKSGEILKDVAEIIVAKHRNGPTDVINLKWIGEMTKFVNFRKDDDRLEATYNLNRENAAEHDKLRAEGKIPPLSPLKANVAGSELPEDHDMPPFQMTAPPQEDDEQAYAGGFVAANQDDMFD